MHELGSMLGRWHQWRAAYSPERRHARAALMRGDGAAHDDDDFEHMLMESLETVIDRMSPQHQLALQHVARAECLGVEVIMSPRLPPNHARREALCVEAMRELERRLIASGLL
jgi:hypothetical protein